tara:strand:- start:225 stop:566 length:342 start_codon:yes stop_codon:yes gene_type:complete
MAKETIKEMLEMIDAKINHIEDITADNRAIIIKLVKQGNTIVQFLKQIEISEEVIDEFDSIPNLTQQSLKPNKIESLKELIDEYMDKAKDLKEFEEELEKHKEDLTPGQVGES